MIITGLRAEMIKRSKTTMSDNVKKKDIRNQKSDIRKIFDPQISRINAD